MNFLFKKVLSRNFTSKLKKTQLFSNTVLGPLSNLRVNLEQRDAVFVSNQSIRWTVKELDNHSDAFANYLIEAGYKPGNKMLLWADVNHSAEIFTSMVRIIKNKLGGIKAGLTIVNSEFENHEDITKNLEASKADILVLSPFTKYENSTRLEILTNYIPELSGNHFKYGDNFKSASFPNLRQIIQISHKTVQGTQKFKNCLSYLKPMMTNINLPQLKPDSSIFSFYSKGNLLNSLNHENALTKVNEMVSHINLDQYSNVLNSVPIFYPSSFLGLLASISNRNYNVLPGSYKLDSIFDLCGSNNCKTVFLESGLLDIQLPKNKVEDLNKLTADVKNVVVFCNESDYKSESNLKLQDIFNNSKVYYYNENTFDLLR